MAPAESGGEGTDGVSAAVRLRERELEVAREIAHAFLTATRPVEVYRLALARLTPLVDASFSSVFLRDPADGRLMKLACAQNWPQSSARFLSQLRIRVGRGPTGRAVLEGSPVEVEDLFQDPALREWWEPARELGFASLIALPLVLRDEVAGALSFYFETPHRFGPEERQLLSLVADQLAATAERAHLIEDLRDANDRLRRQNRELTRRVDEAEEARRVKNEFLANISHEFRTPLTSILGYTYLLGQDEVEGLLREHRETIGKIEHSAEVLLRLVSDLLELSQLKLGRTPIVRTREDAAALARRGIDAADAPPAGVDVRLVPPAEPLWVRTDADKTVKILENLSGNAIKFTRAGEVVVEVRRQGGRPRPLAIETSGDQPVGITGSGGAWAEWSVRDTGIGIHPEDFEAIFDEFRQVDGSSTRLYGGTGLGLALSLRLARLLGGDLTVESEPGVGSTFTLRLPFATGADDE